MFMFLLVMSKVGCASVGKKMVSHGVHVLHNTNANDRMACQEYLKSFGSMD